jgi:alkaline phosphatase
MKQRNYLLALALLALFIASGVVYFRAFVVQKPFGIILFVGEGLVPSQLTAARLYDGGADRRLAVDSLPNVALLSTHAADFAVPDAAAAATALACGVKVNHRALAIDPQGKAWPTLLELARQHGRATGLLTTGCLTDPAPAAFYAHTADQRDRDGIARQLVDQAGLDVVLGGGEADFLPELKGGRRHDERDLVLDERRQGCTVLRGLDELEAVPAWLSPKLLGLFAPDAFAFGDQLTAGSRQPALAEMVRQAIEVLQRKRGGYVLVVAAGLTGRAALANQGERLMQQLVELDRAVGVALQYAGAKTLVIAAGGEATGGFALNGYPLRQDRGVSLLGMNAEGLPAITWATGPNGPGGPSLPAPGAGNAPPAPPAARPGTPAEPAAFSTPYAANVAEDAIAAGFGPGSEKLRGFLDNTFVFDLIRANL